jgi:4'-phosphopantetheinyl transferase
LRLLLASYGTGTPEGLQFAYSSLGKPGLITRSSSSLIEFSVSHSGDRALFGFCRERRIGVDLEYVRRDIDTIGLAKRFFSPDEFRQINNLAATEQCEAFYRTWTRKEAYLKACGEGLAGLAGVEVSLASDAPPIIRKIAGLSDAAGTWTLKHLSPASDYVGAVAVERRSVTFRLFRLRLLMPPPT